jgi:hypothetical protein
MEELLGRSKRDRVGKTLTGAEKEEGVIGDFEGEKSS